MRGDVNLLEIGGGQSRSANNDVRAFREGCEDVPLGSVWLRIFDEHVAGMYESFLSRRIDRTRQARLPKHIAEDAPCIRTRDRSHDREIWFSRDGPRQLRPSPTCRSRDADGESHTVQYGGGVWFTQTRQAAAEYSRGMFRCARRGSVRLRFDGSRWNISVISSFAA